MWRTSGLHTIGPLLFLIYINDIANCTNNLLFYLFADDTSVFITGEKNQTLFDNMNYELPNLSNWFNANFLSLNPNKSNYIVFTGPRIKLPEDSNKSIILNNIAIKRVSYLTDRFQQVYYAKHLSNLAPITCGVSQGSILGPLLFLIYINDIANNLLFYLFADDTSVFITVEKSQNLFDNMNCEIQNLSN